MKRTREASKEASGEKKRCLDASPSDSQQSEVKYAGFLADYGKTFRFRLGTPVHIQPSRFDGESTVLYLRSTAFSKKQALYEYNVRTKQEKELLNPGVLLRGKVEVLSEEEKARRERFRVASQGLVSYQLSKCQRYILAPISGQLYLLDRKTDRTRCITKDVKPAASGSPDAARLDPTAQYACYVRSGSLCLLELNTGVEHLVASSDVEAVSWGLPEFVAMEEMGRSKGYWFGGQGAGQTSCLVYQMTDSREVETLYISDPSHPERKAKGFRYPRAGKTNEKVRLFVSRIADIIASSDEKSSSAGGSARNGTNAFNGDAKAVVRAPAHALEVSWDQKAFPYLVQVRWSKGAPMLIVVQNRRQTESQVLVLAHKDMPFKLLTSKQSAKPVCEPSLLHRELDEAWINIDLKLPVWLSAPPVNADEAKTGSQDPIGLGFLWVSEGSGFASLQIHDTSGSLLGAISSGDVVRYRSTVSVVQTGSQWSEDGSVTATFAVLCTGGPTAVVQHVYMIPFSLTRSATGGVTLESCQDAVEVTAGLRSGKEGLSVCDMQMAPFDKEAGLLCVTVRDSLKDPVFYVCSSVAKEISSEDKENTLATQLYSGDGKKKHPLLAACESWVQGMSVVGEVKAATHRPSFPVHPRFTTVSIPLKPVVVHGRTSPASGSGSETASSAASSKSGSPVDPSCHTGVVNCCYLVPKNFDPSRRYPIILSVYGGPHHNVVFADSRRYFLQQWMAHQGFVVVCIDGRGTMFRGREWERAIKHNVINAPLNDQVTALKALANQFSFMDATRVGVYGWSFGGYFSAMATMRWPEVFRAGFAGAPVCDWLDYDTHYTERYMGLPQENEHGYTASNVLTYCPFLRRPLCVVHGTADDNVYFVHGLKISNALFRAGRSHTFWPLYNVTHMCTDPELITRMYQLMIHFFQQHLS